MSLQQVAAVEAGVIVEVALRGLAKARGLAWRRSVAGFERQLRTLVRRALMNASRMVDGVALAEALASQDRQRLESVLAPVYEQLRLELAGVQALLLASYIAGRRHARRGMGTEAQRFAALVDDPLKANPYMEAVRWAETHSALLVTGVVATTRTAIQTLVARAFSEGIPPRQLAQLILSDTMLGLTEKQMDAVLKLRKTLVDNPGKTVKVGKRLVKVPAQGFTEAQLGAQVDRFADRLLTQRALTIARTETIAAASAGQRSIWDEAVSQGLLSGEERRRWSAADDERTCPICMYLDGQEVGLNEPFVTEDGEEIADSPAHPNCRCSVVLAV